MLEIHSLAKIQIAPGHPKSPLCLSDFFCHRHHAKFLSKMSHTLQSLCGIRDQLHLPEQLAFYPDSGAPPFHLFGKVNNSLGNCCQVFSLCLSPHSLPSLPTFLIHMNSALTGCLPCACPARTTIRKWLRWWGQNRRCGSYGKEVGWTSGIFNFLCTPGGHSGGGAGERLNKRCSRQMYPLYCWVAFLPWTLAPWDWTTRRNASVPWVESYTGMSEII